MKKVVTFLVSVFITVSLFAQPQKMSYQAVIRNADNALVTNHAVGMRISILQTSTAGTAVYVETQTPTTNANGLATIEIGGGTVVTGIFANIDWATGTYFLKTENDPAGGTNYTITAASQLLSVPYALHAKTAETVTGSITETDPLWSASPSFGISGTNILNWKALVSSQWTTNGSDINYTNGKVGIGTSAPASKLQVYGTETGANWAGMGVFGGASNAVIFGQFNDKAQLGAHNAALNAWTDLAINPGGGKVGIGTYTPAYKLDVAGDVNVTGNFKVNGTNISTSSQSFSAPSMTQTEIQAISSPTEGMMVYNKTTKKPNFFDGTDWKNLDGTLSSPVAVTHILANNQITWNWKSVSGAAGYKWSATNDFASAQDMGANTSKTETGLTNGNSYIRYIWAYNNYGASTSTSLSQTMVFIGMNYQGGLVFYIDGTGVHGMIAAANDQSSEAIWGCVCTFLGSFGCSIGIGQANTSNIVACCSENGAAKICDNLELNGYNDWYLPSRDELYQLYLHKSDVGGFANYWYWSSSEYDKNISCVAYTVNFESAGSQSGNVKDSTYRVRAVRSF